MRRKLLILGAVFVIAVPLIAFAALVPCGTSYSPTPCSLCDIFVLGQVITNFLTMTIAPVLAVLAFALAGFKILTSGGSPGARQEGIKILRNTVIGLLIVFGAWIIINELLLFFAGTFFTTSGGNMPWNEIICIAPVTIVPIAVAKFNNRSSDELSALVACVKASVPNLRVTSTTDTNIAAGKCDPTDPNEIFENLNNCQHTKNSCHYGGINCISRGSFAFDFGIGAVSTDPSYDTVRAAVLTCNGAAYVLNETTHGHASIGWVNGCGCDQV
ncbi:hypothetical protein HY839_04210 [Candidatus Azambacteria bacterium]|nr:hypothetical protein [Candidatus Azambacteria bacterium]